MMKSTWYNYSGCLQSCNRNNNNNDNNNNKQVWSLLSKVMYHHLFQKGRRSLIQIRGQARFTIALFIRSTLSANNGCEKSWRFHNNNNATVTKKEIRLNEHRRRVLYGGRVGEGKRGRGERGGWGGGGGPLLSLDFALFTLDKVDVNVIMQREAAAFYCWRLVTSSLTRRNLSSI